MSLMEELASNGVTAEDLEKAASVRLFEKVATEEGIDFATLSDEQIDQLYDHFVQNVLPALNASGDEAVQASDNKQASAPMLSDAEKTASILLFQKVASDENIDLETLDQEHLEGLYAHFLENVLPGMVQEEEVKQAQAADVEEARAKLAEVEILGRHMARSMHDELGKLASADKEAMSKKDMEKMYGKAMKKAKEYGKKAKDEAMKEPEGQPEFLRGKSLLKKGSAGLFDKLAEERANEILEANGVSTGADDSGVSEEQFDDLVTARAVEMLEAAGYTFEE